MNSLSKYTCFYETSHLQLLHTDVQLCNRQALIKVRGFKACLDWCSSCYIVFLCWEYRTMEIHGRQLGKCRLEPHGWRDALYHTDTPTAIDLHLSKNEGRNSWRITTLSPRIMWNVSATNDILRHLHDIGRSLTGSLHWTTPWVVQGPYHGARAWRGMSIHLLYLRRPAS